MSLLSLRTTNIGPAHDLSIDGMSPGVNCITGANGTGKSFLLDCAWWALTGTWAGYPVFPSQKQMDTPSHITFRGHQDDKDTKCLYVPQAQGWKRLLSGKRTTLPAPATDSLVVYARADGGFAVWSDVCNEKVRTLTGKGIPRYYAFDRQAPWSGTGSDDKSHHCLGLNTDFVYWKFDNDGRLLRTFQDMLTTLSDGPIEPIVLGEKRVRICRVADINEYPAVRRRGEDVPVVLAAASIQRIVSLAYVLLWAWEGRERMGAHLGATPERSVVLLVDDVELHLDHTWQFLISRLAVVMKCVSPDIETQVIVTKKSANVLCPEGAHGYALTWGRD